MTMDTPKELIESRAPIANPSAMQDLLGGQIKAESTPGKGLAITIDLPRYAPELAQEDDTEA